MQMITSILNVPTHPPANSRGSVAASPEDLDSLISQQSREIGAEFEQRRKEAVSKLHKCRLYAFIASGLTASFALIFVLSAGGNIDPGAVIIPIVAVTALSFHIAGHPGRLYKQAVKDEAFTRLVRTFGPEFTYRRQGLLPMDYLKRSSLIPHHDEREFEDFISGSWHGVPFALAEAKLIDIRGSGKNRRRVTVFAGVFAVFDLPRQIAGKIIIKRDSGTIGNWFGDTFSSLERVSLEDPTFEKKFEVYGEDQIEARTVLTTTFMERLYQMAEHLGDGRMQGAFYEGKFMAMIPCSRDRFEPSLTLAEGAVTRDLERFAADLKDIAQITERLRLERD